MKRSFLFIYLFVLIIFFSSAISSNVDYQKYTLNKGDKVDLEVRPYMSYITFVDAYNISNFTHTTYVVSTLIEGNSYYIFESDNDFFYSDYIRNGAGGFMTPFDDISYLLKFNFTVDHNRSNFDKISADKENDFYFGCDIDMNFDAISNKIIITKYEKCLMNEGEKYRIDSKGVEDFAYIIFINGYKQSSDLYQYIKNVTKMNSSEGQFIQAFFNKASYYSGSDIYVPYIFVDISSKENLLVYDNIIKKYNIDLDKIKNYTPSNTIPLIILNIVNANSDNPYYSIRDSFTNFRSISDLPLEKVLIELTNISDSDNNSEYFPDENSCKYMYSNYSIGLIDECLNYNAFRGPEIWGLQYYIDNNNQVTVFKKGIIEALSFAGMNYGPSFSAKIVRYYEDGRREIVSERNDRLIDDIFSIDDWAVLMNVRDKKAALKNNNLEVTNIDFLSKNNKIETQIIEGELYSEPVRAKLSLLDLYYCKNEKKYISITAGVEDMELGEVYIDPIDSSQKDEIITLSRDGVLSVKLDKNKKFIFDKKVTYVYEDNSEDDRFVIGLVDFYIEGDETENYIELSFIKTSYKKLDGIFEFVYLREIDGYDTYEERSFTVEELNYMGYSDLRNPFQCSINSQCLFDGKCYPLGYRKDNRYCSEERFNFRFQKESKEFCENNFECVSNVCLENECIGTSFLQKVLNWFRNLFNIE